MADLSDEPPITIGGRTYLSVTDRPAAWNENKMLALMEADCTAGFPYVCTGRKHIENGTDVRCECGARMRV